MLTRSKLAAGTTIAVAATAALGGVAAGIAATTSPKVQAATVRLPRGTSVRSFQIAGVNLRNHTMTVDIHAIASARFTVTMLVPNNGTLYLFNTSAEAGLCQRGAGNIICHMKYARFPTSAGRWTVSIAKRSAPRAAVVVAVGFSTGY